MRLEWTELLLLDLENIRDYIAKDSPYYAARFIARIIEATDVDIAKKNRDSFIIKI